MAIKPITGAAPVNSYINFSSRKRHDYSPEVEYTPQSSTSSKLRQVPVIVMIAMSPLTTASSTLPRIDMIEDSAPKVEVVDQQGKEVVVLRVKKSLGNQKIQYIGMSNDNDVNTFEKMFFKYQDDSKIGKKGLFGKVVAVCPQQDVKNRYLVAYRNVIDSKTSEDISICFIPKQLGDILYAYCTIPFNNKAIGVVPKAEFEQYFGRNSVNSAVEIKDKPMIYPYVFDASERF